MTALIIILCVALISIIVVQIGKVTELATKIRGEEEVQQTTNSRQGLLSLLFMILFLVAVIVSSYSYRNYFLGYGPLQAASEHGGSLDYLFNITLFFTGIVFIVTHIFLFYFAWKYRGRIGRKANYMPHDNRLEVIWTVIPAVVMTFLVVGGLDAWNEVMADVGPEDDYIEIEATGYQFAWHLRYPGEDGKLGARDYKLISGTNPLGQDWTDEKNHDDFHPSEVVLPVNQKVRVRITARDVLHNFYLPHFRLKMDAVPGMPTYFVFTPTKTTEEYRQELRQYDEYNVPLDPNDPESPMLWENFNYELACAELCGAGHFSMRRIVRVVSPEEFEQWKKEQQSYYLSTIRGSDDDPYTNELFDFEIEERREAFISQLNEAVEGPDTAAKVLELEYVTFETGSAELGPLSKYQLNDLATYLKQNPTMRIQLAGHTDNTGAPEENMTLSENRARMVYDYLVEQGVEESRLSAIGYGDTRPVDTNDTDAGREKNRRTEVRIVSL